MSFSIKFPKCPAREIFCRTLTKCAKRPGDVSVGDPAYDLASAWMLFDASGREVFRATTRSRYDDATWVRARAWAAYIALVLLTQSDDRPDHFAVGQSTAEELESD